MFNFNNEDDKEENGTIEEKKDKYYYRKTYFYIIEEVIRITGSSKNEEHENLKKEVLSKIITKKSTKDLNTEEWKIYIEKVKEYLYEELDLIF